MQGRGIGLVTSKTMDEKEETLKEVHLFSLHSIQSGWMEQTGLCSDGLFKQQPVTKLCQFALIAIEGEMQMSLMNTYNSAPGLFSFF